MQLSIFYQAFESPSPFPTTYQVKNFNEGLMLRRVDDLHDELHALSRNERLPRRKPEELDLWDVVVRAQLDLELDRGGVVFCKAPSKH